jgi:hypothetical protein
VPRIGRYELRALLGVGGMGSVYEAYDTELDRSVALKVLRPELGRAPGLADRLVRESRLMAKVAHPAVITVYDVGCDGDTVFITMEVIRGSTLTGELAGIRSARKRLMIATSVAGLIGFGGAVALAIAPTGAPVDRCLGALDSLTRAYNPELEAQLAGVLAAEPKLQSQVVTTLRDTAERWRRTHLATCHA